MLHGFLDTWRTWELVLPALERRHDVLALTLPGHAGGPPLPARLTATSTVAAVEAAMDAAGIETAHVAGNSLGGFLALQLAARGRARSVVALSPAGGWGGGSAVLADTLAEQERLHAAVRAGAGQAETLMATPAGRRRATASTTVAYEHLPAELLAHQMVGIARCDAGRMLRFAATDPYEVDLAAIACPVRVVWGREDQILPWPAAAARLRRELWHADWVELDDVGHAPQLDVPVETAQLILGWTGV
ncbi:alpha/beta hydrolase [Patulibacter sp. SYSU D01012]|uniref:alpha/beta fold hydrolase n=1 Tax=Patulibacter sp. SYSU D01012 TaxID=2817381 RepID=UPI0032C04AB9